jgi:hypothetical protein
MGQPSRRDARKVDPFVHVPGHKPLERRDRGFLWVRIVVLGMEEFIQGEACPLPLLLDQ